MRYYKATIFFLVQREIINCVDIKNISVIFDIFKISCTLDPNNEKKNPQRHRNTYTLVLSLATLVVTSILVLAIVCIIVDGMLLSSNLRQLTSFARSNSSLW